MEVETDKTREEEALPRMEEEQCTSEQRINIEEACSLWKISDILLKNLQNEGITEFFEIQTKAIPELINCDRCGIARDICISAPTGSGKTLTYVIPILQALMNQPIHRLRALVVLPTRDLALQVKSVFDLYVENTGLKVGISIGKQDFKEEQITFGGEGQGWKKHLCDNSIDGFSNIDILVCTPGRISDHINSGSSFTLQHLRYLVIDEVDRLLTQDYYSWIHTVYSSCFNSNHGSFVCNEQTGEYTIHIPTSRQGGEQGITHIYDNIPLRRILCSATLPNNPQSLSKLYLHNPLYYTIKKERKSQFALPETLSQYVHIVDGGYKPMYLCESIRDCIKLGQKVLIFANSIDTCHRLYTLLTIYYPQYSGLFGEYSASLSQALRSQTLQMFAKNPSLILVCTDNLSRGIDIKNVDIVINYDAPVYVRTYVHRAGRTARAGCKGSVYTYVRNDQVYHFKQMIKPLHTRSITYTNIKNEEDVEKISQFSECLEKLKAVLERQHMK